MDERITALLQSGGHDEAFALLLADYRRKVFGLCFSLLRDRHAAEDAAQEAFVKIWRALPGFDGRAALSTWIYAITRNTAISQLRTRRAEASLSDPEVLAAAEAATATHDDTGQDHETVARLVADLPERQRAVVTLYYLQEKSVDEVGTLLGMPAGTVKTLLYRARARLAEAAGASTLPAAGAAP